MNQETRNIPANGPGRPDAKSEAVSVSIVSVAINRMLSLFKIAAGFIGKSTAIISDGIHSASDVFASIIVIIGVKLAGKQADEDHPYGHERIECIAAVILAFILAIVGFEVGKTGAVRIISRDYASLAVPGMLPLIASAVSIAVKEWMFWYTRAAAKRNNSTALMAEAWHHRSDALSSVGSFIGIFFARIGYPVMDAVASVIICVFILKVAADIFRDGLDRLIDKSCDRRTIDKISETAMSVEGVVSVDDIKTRLFGDRIYVDVEIAADGSMSLSEAHGIADEVHDRIEETFPLCKHCMVHVNPFIPRK